MKLKLAGLLACIGLLTPSCLGPNNAFRSVHNWNAEVSDQDAVNEIIFIAMVIVPVYGVALLGDYLIFNTIEYWSGDNPINDPGPFPGNFHNKD